VDIQWCAECLALLQATPLANQTRQLDDLTILSTGLHTAILRDAVHALKYGGATLVAAPLAVRLAQALQAQNWTFDMLIPVPLHPARLAERGYNQSEQLCNHLTQELHIPHVPHALQRQRNTPHQVGLHAAERLENVADAFTLAAAAVAGKRVLLIDDVCTTGATLSACAQVIFNGGAASVTALTLTTAL
jgi:ComF family protein